MRKEIVNATAEKNEVETNGQEEGLTEPSATSRGPQSHLLDADHRGSRGHREQRAALLRHSSGNAQTTTQKSAKTDSEGKASCSSPAVIKDTGLQSAPQKTHPHNLRPVSSSRAKSHHTREEVPDSQRCLRVVASAQGTAGASRGGITHGSQRDCPRSAASLTVTLSPSVAEAGLSASGRTWLDLESSSLGGGPSPPSQGSRPPCPQSLHCPPSQCPHRATPRPSTPILGLRDRALPATVPIKVV